MRFYRLLTISVALLVSFRTYGQIATAVADNPAAILEDTQITFDATANDIGIPGIDKSSIDFDQGSAGIQGTASTAEGEWSADSEGFVTFIPTPDFFGEATITYTIQNTGGIVLISLPAQITITVTSVNDVPSITAIADQSTSENTATSAIAFTIGDLETPAGSLTVSGTSSNTTLVPDGNISFGGADADRTVSITPTAGQSGTTTIEITVSDGDDITSTSFTLTVSAVNGPPTISSIADQSTPENTPTAAIAFTIGDAETPANNLTVSGTSTNTTLVPNANISFAGTGTDRTVTITPANGQSGTTTIEITVDDGTDAVSTSFTLTVSAVNDLPTISAITNQSTPENTPAGPIAFTIGDTETPADNLTVSGTSSNTTLVPNANISFGGTGTDRTVTLTPANGQSGTTTIEITVSDGTDVASTSFTLTVNAVNDPPTISAIADQSTPENTATGAIAFTIGDLDNAPATLTVTGTSSNTSLVPNVNITFGGAGTARTITVTPAPGQSGTTTITITVSDGTADASTSFVLSVNDVNDPPTISAISDQTTTENTSTSAIPFTINDAETPAANLTVTGASSNAALVPVANISFGGSGADRTVTINPGASQSGTATITITVSDGTSSAATSFELTVDPVNDAPTVTPISNQTTAENTATSAIPFNIGDAETPASNLILTASSSVTTLVPNGNIELAGSGSDRTVTITPVTGQSGTTDITINVSDGTAVTSITFTLTVSSVNDAPTITAITNQTTNEDVATPALPFTLSDPDTPASSLTVTATSSNKTLVPDANIALFGDDISRTVTVTPAANQTGVTTITLTVSDGTASASTSFQVTVVGVNDTPTITAVSDQTTSENTPTAPIAFNVNDGETPPGALTVTGSSSNAVLVPNGNISLGGSGEGRTVTITPAGGQSGTTTITLTVSDGTATASISFQLTVTSVNDAPTITAVAPQTTNEDVATGAISFTIGDSDSPASSLSVIGSSSNKTLVPDANISITNSGVTRTVTITPAANQNGTTVITLTVTDGTASAQTTFNLTVTPVNDPPTITAQVPLTTPENTSITLVPANFTIEDPDNGPSDYSLIIVQGNYTSSGSTITPPKDFDGELLVALKVTDGKLLSPEFTAKITVTDVNLAPVITGQAQNPFSITTNFSLPLTPGDLIITDPDSDPQDFELIISPGDNYSLSGPTLTTITPALDYVGPIDVVVKVSDGKAQSAPYTLKINVVLPSSRPLINGQIALITDEDVPFTLELDYLSVTDTDTPGYPIGFSLNIQGGDNYSVSDNQIIPARNYNGFLTVPVTVSDGQAPSDPPFNVRIYVAPVNDAPEITAFESDPISYEPGTGPISITEIFECIDVDNEFLTLAEIGLIDSAYSPTNDELIFENSDTSPIRGIYDASKGVLSLIGYATPEDYIAAIKSVKYNYRLTLDDNGEQSQISTEPKRVYINLSDGQSISGNKERSIELETSVELSIPNAFTPNGDAENNTWAVQPFTKTDQFNNTVIKVYNKRGLLVYEAVGLENEWDGTYNGELLPVDTYYYTIDLKLSFTKKTYKGSVTILR